MNNSICLICEQFSEYCSCEDSQGCSEEWYVKQLVEDYERDMDHEYEVAYELATTA